MQQLLPLIAVGALLLYALWPWLSFGRGARSPRTIVFYGFSILGEVMNKGVFPQFQREWEKKTGESVQFVSSFAGSGTVTNQLIMGVPAHMALLSLELDALRLSGARVTEPQSWTHLPFAGVLNRTPFVILVRPGNPKNIHDFADLTRADVRIVHPDPLTSGGANWAILAEYGAGTRNGGGRAVAGYELLLGIWRNVVAQAASARAARTQFENGFGDALVTYEQEALWDKTRGRLRSEIIYPRSTILSEHILVVLNRNISKREQELVGAFVRFLWSDPAQATFVRYGFRSMRDELNAANPEFGRIQDPFRVADFGGWRKAKSEIVDTVWKQRVLREIGK